MLNCHQENADGGFYLNKEVNDLDPISLSILVVNCKDCKPSRDWYLCKSGRYFTGAERETGKRPKGRDIPGPVKYWVYMVCHHSIWISFSIRSEALTFGLW